MNGKIVHIADDGTQTDVTEGVQALYDLVLQSMDWGSGFWTYEDALPVVKIAQLSGFEQADEAERYVREALHKKESDEWQRRQTSWPQAYEQGRSVPHDHVWSSVGKCMWTFCSARPQADDPLGERAAPNDTDRRAPREAIPAQVDGRIAGVHHEPC